MQPGAGQPAAGRFLRRQSPAAGDLLGVFVAVVPFDMKDRTELAARERFAQRAYRWPEAPVMADGEDDAGRTAGTEHARRVARTSAPAAFRKKPAFAQPHRRSPAPDAANAASPAGPHRSWHRRGRHRDRRSSRDRAGRKIPLPLSCQARPRERFSAVRGQRRPRPDYGPSGRDRRWRRGSSQSPGEAGGRRIASMTAALSRSGPSSAMAARNSSA